MGGKYIVLFEMDDNGINHAQVPSQARKARGISSSAFTIGLLTGNHSAFIGGMAAANTSMYTGFSQTRKVRFYPNRDLIKIRQLLFRNQISCSAVEQLLLRIRISDGIPFRIIENRLLNFQCFYYIIYFDLSGRFSCTGKSKYDI